MPTEIARGEGTAFDATITAVNNISQLEAAAQAAQEALAAARAEAEAQRPFVHVANMERKVAKFRAMLAEAEQNLADAHAALNDTVGDD